MSKEQQSIEPNHRGKEHPHTKHVQEETPVTDIRVRPLNSATIYATADEGLYMVEGNLRQLEAMNPEVHHDLTEDELYLVYTQQLDLGTMRYNGTFPDGALWFVDDYEKVPPRK